MTEKKRILLVSSAFFPELSPRSFRATELAKEFYRKGHEVTVISKFRDYDYSNFLKETPIVFRMWNKPIWPAIPDFNTEPIHSIARGIKRLLLLLFEYPAIVEMFKVKGMLKAESGYDMVLSFAVPYPVHWGVAWSRTRRHRIASFWVADCGDPYMGDVLDTFKKPFYFKFIEKWFCKKANYITVPIEGAINGYYPEFHQKIRIIPQGFRFDFEWKTNELPRNQIPTFAYAGGFIPGVRDPGLLLDYLITLKLSFKFYVYTNQPEILDHYKFILKDNLVISSYVPREELLYILSGMDFLINFDNNTSLNSPSKLIDYALSRRPILNINSSNLDKSLVMEFLNGNYSGQRIIELSNYDIGKVSMQFLSLIN